MRQPKYQLRMSAELLAALTKAGSTAVRTTLESIYLGTTEKQAVVPITDTVVPGSTQIEAGSTQEPPPVVPIKPAVVPEKKPVAPGTTQRYVPPPTPARTIPKRPSMFDPLKRE